MQSAVLVSACSLILACGASPVAPDIPFRVIGHGGFRVMSAETRVIRDPGAWADFIQQTALRAPSYRPEDPIPEISFSNEMVIALLLGARPLAGYQIRIDGVTERGRSWIVKATEIVPCVGATVISYPLTAVAVPRTDRRVTVEWSRHLPDCR